MRSPFERQSMFLWVVRDILPPGINAWEENARDFIISIMKEVGFSTALIKVADSGYSYNQQNVGGLWEDTIVPPLMERLGSEGFPKVGWHYLYGKYPDMEIDRAIERINTLKLDGYILDMETEWKSPAMASVATKVVGSIRRAFPNLPLALCSYRFPSYHQEFPWKYVLQYFDKDRGDIHMPQLYYAGDNRDNAGVIQMDQSLDELTLQKDLPFVFAGPLYQWKTWLPTKIQIDNFEARALEYRESGKCIGVSHWEWGHHLKKLDGLGPQSSSNLLWWDTLKSSCQLWNGDIEPPEPPPEPPPNPSDSQKLSTLWTNAVAYPPAGWDMTNIEN